MILRHIVTLPDYEFPEDISRNDSAAVIAFLSEWDYGDSPSEPEAIPNLSRNNRRVHRNDYYVVTEDFAGDMTLYEIVDINALDALDALDRIYLNLQAGEVYGDGCQYRVDYPTESLRGKFFFWWRLAPDRDGKYFYWRNFGQSACKATKRDLEWTILNIFKCSPEEFEERYVLESEFDPNTGGKMA